MLDKLKKTEFWVAVAGAIAAVGTALLDSGVLAPVPKVAAILSLMVIVATYVAGRSWVKATKARAKGLRRAGVNRAERTEPRPPAPPPDERMSIRTSPPSVPTPPGGP